MRTPSSATRGSPSACARCWRSGSSTKVAEVLANVACRASLADPDDLCMLPSTMLLRIARMLALLLLVGCHGSKSASPPEGAVDAGPGPTTDAKDDLPPGGPMFGDCPSGQH